MDVKQLTCLGIRTGEAWAKSMIERGHKDEAGLFRQEWLKNSGANVPMACEPIIAPFATVAQLLGAFQPNEDEESESLNARWFRLGFVRGAADYHEQQGGASRDDLPDVGDIEEQVKAACELENALARIKELWNDDGFPAIDELQELAKEAAILSATLTEASEQDN